MKHGNKGPDLPGSGSDPQQWLRGQVSLGTGKKNYDDQVVMSSKVMT
jgi:hypothetical protein